MDKEGGADAVGRLGVFATHVLRDHRELGESSALDCVIREELVELTRNIAAHREIERQVAEGRGMGEERFRS